MSKRKLELHFGGASTTWIIDTDIHDSSFVMVGIEEHYLDDEKEEVFKTEQLLDIHDLQRLKSIINRTLSEMGLMK